MAPQDLGLLFTSVMASVVGQYFLKAGAIKLGRVTGSNLVSHVLSIVSTPELTVGLVSYAIGAIAYILLLTRVDLSIAAPAIALSYIFSVLIGYFFFSETIPISRVIGLALIIAGVILVLRRPS